MDINRLEVSAKDGGEVYMTIFQKPIGRNEFFLDFFTLDDDLKYKLLKDGTLMLKPEVVVVHNQKTQEKTEYRDIDHVLLQLDHDLYNDGIVAVETEHYDEDEGMFYDFMVKLDIRKKEIKIFSFNIKEEKLYVIDDAPISWIVELIEDYSPIGDLDKKFVFEVIKIMFPQQHEKGYWSVTIDPDPDKNMFRVEFEDYLGRSPVTLPLDEVWLESVETIMEEIRENGIDFPKDQKYWDDLEDLIRWLKNRNLI